MPSHKSAAKEHRQELGRRARNRGHRSRLRTAVKQLQVAIDSGEAEQARGMLNGTLSLLDRTAKLGAIHTSAADRKKSRLTVAVNRIGAAQ